ncbi:NAD-dependent epimerase/dehydratase family protein [Shimia sp. FJ5]|uniref:NAD-dependent epimerase/dehydratase family protein n=1 Tax=Shimia sp. FJ5 TaxID=3079054 RepID=UPI002611D13E|nr:NAD-dependent epimerase/dehydratase family protein [Shimia sp. FJ5]MDV4146164.1 epimerase [Shimia sp. FJ5]
MTKTVLVLGGHGRFGRHAAIAFLNAGWTVRAFDRRKDDLLKAATGCDVIVAAWNPAYPDWAEQVPELHRRIIETAQATGATVIIPANVYVYGDGSPSILMAETPHNATNPLGRIRIEMERAYRESGIPVLFLRAGDFIDTEPSGNWFDQIMVKSLHNGKLTYPGKAGIPHAWAYLPDLARAAVLLAEKPDFPSGAEEVLFPGYQLSGEDIASNLEAITERPIRVHQMNWLPIQLAAPFWKMGKCLAEMRYLWNMPHQLDGSRFDTLLPDFKATPIQEALSRATAHLRSA